MSKAPNIKLVRIRRSRKIVEIQVREFGDDSKEPAKLGNPRRYSHDHETDQNPANCWTLKSISEKARPVFHAVVSDCLKAA